MGFEDILDDMNADIFSALGRSATYTPAVGDPVSCQVDLVIQSDQQPVGFESTVLEPETVIEYILDEVGREADPGDVFTVSGVDYTVKELRENDGWTVKIVVKNES